VDTVDAEGTVDTEPIPMIDLAAQHRTMAAEVEAAVQRVLRSQRFVLGPEGEALEHEIADYSGCRHAVALSSGTDAILAALMAIGVGAGDEVVTTPYTFLGTVTPIARLGARAVFVDIERDTFNLDVARVEAAIGPRTRCILPVHLFGQMVDMGALAEIARRRGIPVIEDAAQAIGASRDGKPVGAGSLAATLSFHPSKNLGGAGDGGMLLTDDEGLAKSVRLLRNHGQSPKHVSTIVGGNFRLDEIQAAILRVKLPHVDEWTSARRRNAATYREAFARRSLPQGLLEPPHESVRARHAYNQFVVRAPRRDELKAFLAEASIASEVYYPQPMHLQVGFSNWGGYKGQFPHAEEAARESLALPVYPELRSNQIERIADTASAFVRSRIAP
jgi:dTDP-4-amino-4,6-dideoxygalactose transaminase